jgi:hypothetical protein
MIMPIGTSTERVIRFAREQAERTECTHYVWRLDASLGVTRNHPAGTTLIGTARFTDGRAGVLWEPAA